MPKVSVIIPIYKVEKYLGQTLSSVTGQTMRDIEIICVNDCSPDRCKEIIESFARKDSRVRPVNLPENRGEGLARKAGILVSTGDYIMFLDGDDYYAKDACRKAYNSIKRNQTDMLQFGTRILPEDPTVDKMQIENLRILLKPSKENFHCDKGSLLIRECFENKRFGYNVANKIFRGDIVRKAVCHYAEERFDVAADAYLFYLIAMFCTSCSFIRDELYCYHFGAGITGGNKISNRIMENRIRQGRIIQLLNEFSASFDPENITGNARKELSNLFLDGIFFGWSEMAYQADCPAQISLALEYFGADSFLAGAMYHYQFCDYRHKAAMIDALKNSDEFDAVPHTVKTVATFYHRMYNGGVERVLSKLIPMWTQMGYRVVLFTDEPANAKDYPYGNNIVRILLPKVTNGTQAEYSNRISVLQDSLRRYQVDLMVYHAWISYCLAPDMLAVKLLRIPFIVHTHGFFACGQTFSNSPDVVRSILLQKLYSLADSVITLSETDRSWWSVIHPRVYKTLNPLTFDLTQTQPDDAKDSFRYDILWVGRIAPEKQPFDALAILKQILASGVNATLHMVGGTDDETFADALKKEIKKLNIASNVVMHGYQSDIFPYYKESKVLLFTSKLEGAPMTLAECLSSGVPVVMYNLPYLDLPRGNSGVRIVPQNAVSAAADAVIDILTNPETRRTMSKAARQSVEEAYSADLPTLWQKIFDDVGQLRTVPSDISPDMLCNAMLTMNDHTAEGIENREVTHPQASSSYVLRPWEYADVLLQMYKNGEIGFRYIVKYAVAWLRFKLTRKQRSDKI